MCRVNQERYPHILLYGHCDGNRRKAGLNKKWINNIKEYCSDPGVTLNEATRLNEDRGTWRHRSRYGLPACNDSALVDEA